MTTSGKHFILFISVIFWERFIISTVKSKHCTQVRIAASQHSRQGSAAVLQVVTKGLLLPCESPGIHPDCKLKQLRDPYKWC